MSKLSKKNTTPPPKRLIGHYCIDNNWGSLSKPINDFKEF